jgi:superfamily II DNA/RNA helicase
MQKLLEKLEITALNNMQLAAIKSIKEEKNTLLLAPTGSGKTLAFLIPLLDLLQPQKKELQTLIIVPTRELALQIETVFKSLKSDFKINALYGGHSMEVETKNLQTMPEVIVGTPGRIADHFTRDNITGENVRSLILDEFDKSLQMGYQEQMKYIYSHLNNLEKHILVSATGGLNIPDFLFLNPLKKLDFLNENLNLEIRLIKAKSKVKALLILLGQISLSPTMIFCNLRDSAEEIAATMRKNGLNAELFHGKIEQIDREKALIRFRNGSSRYLVSTDLAARGLDIPEVENVIHFELPDHLNEFTHRNGRTARQMAEGTAFIILDEKENLPTYLPKSPKIFELLEKTTLPPKEKWVTVYVSGGKKDKINKIDIVGFFLQKGKLQKEELGRIEVQDFATFVAISSDAQTKFFKLIVGEKLKGKKLKIELAR